MNRTLTCIICPNGCELEIAYEGDQILSVTGNKCPKGAEYAEQEIKNPMRTIASSVNLVGGSMPLVSVRVNGPIPKAKIMDVTEVIRKTTVTAPVKIGDVVIADVLGLGVDVVATRNVDAKGFE